MSEQLQAGVTAVPPPKLNIKFFSNEDNMLEYYNSNPNTLWAGKLLSFVYSITGSSGVVFNSWHSSKENMIQMNYTIRINNSFMPLELSNYGIGLAIQGSSIYSTNGFLAIQNSIETVLM